MLQTMRSSAKYIFWFIFVTFVGGFLLAETSGLLGTATLTPGTAIATVNGEEISYQAYLQTVNNIQQQREQQLGRGLTLDERKQVEDEALEQHVTEILLRDEFERRGIAVTDAEIQEAAQFSPPPELMQNPDLQTEGRFDRAKYERFLRSPAARQQGVLLMLENYYRNEIPKQKLFEQVAGDVYVSDARLWQIWRDTRDTAEVSFVVYRPETLSDSGIAVADADVRKFYDANKKDFERPGRAVVSVIKLSRAITAADSAATREHIVALRNEIAAGAKFEDVARRESNDSVSGADGGSLGRGGRGRFVPEFENAAYALKPGEVSQPVQTSFGYHLIRVDERKGDTLSLRHILLRVRQSDSTAARTDRRADSLANLAADSDQREKFDSAAKKLGLPVVKATAFEGSPLILEGTYAPSISAWAFGGARAGETSSLIDGEDAYYLARLDTIFPGGTPSLTDVETEIRRGLIRKAKVDRLMPPAQDLAKAAASSSLEQAASSRGLTVEKSGPFTRLTAAPTFGQYHEAIGAAFTLPVGQVSAPIKTRDGVYVERVDRRVQADSAAWAAQKAVQRQGLTQNLRQQRVREFLENLRKAARIDDKRKDVLQRQADS